MHQDRIRSDTAYAIAIICGVLVWESSVIAKFQYRGVLLLVLVPLAIVGVASIAAGVHFRRRHAQQQRSAP